MVSFWARIATVFNIFSFNPTNDLWIEQLPLASLTDATTSVIPTFLGGDSGAPDPFTPPSAPIGSKFKCNYPDMKNYVFCSTPGDRSCWLKDMDTSRNFTFDISTNYEKFWPKGDTRKYWLEIADKVIAPDGVERPGMVVNGTFPGPWIRENCNYSYIKKTNCASCWGDDIEITVTNKLKTNGTTIHWHGIRQYNTTAHDGVNAITQCPIAKDSSYTYKFKAVQYGTSWYHSHYSLQYGDGILGPMTIHGPSTADYDFALDPVMMQEWIHVSWFTRWWRKITKTTDGTERIKNIIVYGKDTWPPGKPSKNFQLDFQPGRRYLLRLINTSVDTTFVFSIDNHKVQVVGADFVPIEPYMTDHVSVGIGQRYHIIVTANPVDGKDGGTYWIRTIPAKGCDPEDVKLADNRTGIVTYDKGKSEPIDYPVTFNTTCRDEPYDKLIPKLKWKVGPPSNIAVDSQFDISLITGTVGDLWPANVTKARWGMYDQSMWLDFSNPTLEQDLTKSRDAYNPYSVVVKEVSKDSKDDNWVYLLVSASGVPQTGRTYIPVAHPIHLHGHDFAILQQSYEPYRIGGLKLNLENPPRRDVAFMPSNGYLVLAFKADNPGVWLMHCHIAEHASGGLAMQIIENGANVSLSSFDKAQMERTCREWDVWVGDKRNHFLQDDSGI